MVLHLVTGNTLLTPQKDSKVSGQVSVSRNRVDTVLLGTHTLRWEPDWCPLWCLTSADTRKSQSKAKPSTQANQKQWVLMWLPSPGLARRRDKLRDPGVKKGNLKGS